MSGAWSVYEPSPRGAIVDLGMFLGHPASSKLQFITKLPTFHAPEPCDAD